MGMVKSCVVDPQMTAQVCESVIIAKCTALLNKMYGGRKMRPCLPFSPITKLLPSLAEFDRVAQREGSTPPLLGHNRHVSF